jgi:hypothetical protein
MHPEAFELTEKAFTPVFAGETYRLTLQLKFNRWVAALSPAERE